MKFSRRRFLGSSLGTALPVFGALARPVWAADLIRAGAGTTPRNAHSNPPEAGVTVLRTPHGGIQPQAVADSEGMIHLIYFKGDPAAGNVFYVSKLAGASEFSAPRQVNNCPGSAMAIGSVRGAQIALGKNGRVHVAWLGSAEAEPRGPGNATPMLYTRLNDAGTAFEPQRNVMQYATGLDGGGSVAADRFGNVYVAWHANPAADGEVNRRVYVARSDDGGKTFGREAPANREPTGACGCCGMRAFADERGTVYVLYRTATERIHRDMELLMSDDRGRTFAGRRIAKWTLDACPMSTASISKGGQKVLAAWETAGQVYCSNVGRELVDSSAAVAAPGDGGDRKHPSVAVNADGETLLAWTEGTAWQKGGSVAWQRFDRSGCPMGAIGRATGLPVWGLVAAVARPDRGFTVLL